MKTELETERLILIPCDEKILKTILQGDESLKDLLQIKIPATWTESGAPAFRYSLNQLNADPESKSWWTYLPILKEGNILVGSCGYKGKPDENGMVEIGYEVAESYRNQRLATEIAKGLIIHAFKNNDVKTVRGHTLAEENASSKVLRNCGMIKIAEINDPDDGELWRWEIRK